MNTPRSLQDAPGGVLGSDGYLGSLPTPSEPPAINVGAGTGIDREAQFQELLQSLAPSRPVDVTPVCPFSVKDRLYKPWDIPEIVEGPIALDIETEDPERPGVPDYLSNTSRVVSIAICTCRGDVFPIDPEELFELSNFLRLCPRVYLHNASYDAAFLEAKLGIRTDAYTWYDTMLGAAHAGLGLERGNYKNLERYGLKPLVKKLFGVEMADFNKVAGWVCDPDHVKLARRAFDETSKQVGFSFLPAANKKILNAMRKHVKRASWRRARASELPFHVLHAYNGLDAYYTWKLGELLRTEKKVPEGPLLLDHRLVPVLCDMRTKGFPVDAVAVGENKRRLADRRASLMAEWAEVAGGVEFASTKQCAELLQSLGLPLERGPRTEKGAPALGEEALLWWQKQKPPSAVAKIINLMLELRTVSKLEATFVAPLVGKERVRCQWHILGTDTGRLSASEPNMTFQPKGAVAVGLQEIRPRDMFCAEPGCYILSADWAQLEICIMAHVSKDPVLIETIRSGKSMHDVTAELLGVPRPVAKVFNLAVNYGAEAGKIHSQLGDKFTRPQVEGLLERYKSLYKGISEYKRKALGYTRKHGFMITVGGRRRYFNEARSEREIQALMRQAGNHGVQGTAAELAKEAMLRCVAAGLDLRLQVHDELVFMVKKDLLVEAASKVADIMTSVYTLEVPLSVGLSYGESWGSMEELKL